MASTRRLLKSTLLAVATILVTPELISFWVRSRVFGRDRALESSSQLLGLIPGIFGQYLRRAFLMRVLAKCDSSTVVEFGTLFSQCGASLSRNVYVGAHCQLGLVDIGPDVLIASGVHIPSGGKTHSFERLDIPIQDQGGERTCVRIGPGAWIGSGAIVMADVGEGTIVGAGAVVVKPLPSFVVAGGVPARVLRDRNEAAE